MDAHFKGNVGTAALQRAANDNTAAARPYRIELAPSAALGTPLLAGSKSKQACHPAAPKAAGLTFHAYSTIHRAADAWEELQSDALVFPFQTFEWLYAWHQDIGAPRGIKPFIVVGRDEKRKVRILFPLGIERGWLTTRLVWLGHPTCDYNAPLTCPQTLAGLSVEDAAAIWRAVLSLEPSLDYAYLSRQPAMIGGAANPFHHVSAYPFSADAHAATLDASWDTFYRDRRSGRARNKNSRMEKRLAALGDLRFDCVEDPAERSELVAWTLDLKHRQLINTGARSPFGGNDVRRFFDRVSANDDVTLFRLSLDSEPLAVVLGLVRNGCFYYLVPVYEFGAHARCSPGNTLLLKVMEWCIDQGLTRFDFTIGDEAYKRDWSDIRMPMSCTCLPVSLKGWLATAMVTRAMAAKKLLKRHPFALKAASAVVTLLQRPR